MNPPDEDSPLLHHWHDRHPPLPDDGFSERVLAALPPAAPRYPTRVWLPVAAGAVAGLAAFGTHLPSAADWERASVVLTANLSPLLSVSSTPWLAAALGVTLGSLLVGYLTFRWSTRGAW